MFQKMLQEACTEMMPGLTTGRPVVPVMMQGLCLATYSVAKCKGDRSWMLMRATELPRSTSAAQEGSECTAWEQPLLFL